MCPPSEANLAKIRAVLVETGMAMNRGKVAEVIAREIEQYVREKR